MPAREAESLAVHKALADDTRFRLFRYLGLSGRPVSVRELSTRLSLHPNTLRPHLRRLEEAGLVRRETRKGAATVGRPQTLYVAVDRDDHEGRDYRLLAEILTGLATGTKARGRAQDLARDWGRYLAVQGGPKPGTRLSARGNLAVLQGAMARAGFDPRFRRAGRGSGRGLPPRLPVPRSARRSSRSGVCDPSRAGRGDARGTPAEARARLVRAVRGANDLPIRRSWGGLTVRRGRRGGLDEPRLDLRRPVVEPAVQSVRSRGRPRHRSRRPPTIRSWHSSTTSLSSTQP